MVHFICLKRGVAHGLIICCACWSIPGSSGNCASHCGVLVLRSGNIGPRVEETCFFFTDGTYDPSPFQVPGSFRVHSCLNAAVVAGVFSKSPARRRAALPLRLSDT